MSEYSEALELIKGSNLFDKEWYLKKYRDVGMLSMDPVEHYLKIGARLHRDPGPNFSTRGYLQAYPDVEQAGYNPLYHYLKWGKDEGRLAPLSRAAREDRKAISAQFESPRREPALGRARSVSFPEQAGPTGKTSGDTDELEQELVRTKKRCQELTEENELLLLQLRQVQEEFEEYFLKYQELAAESNNSA